jgi:hypothetical protein
MGTVRGRGEEVERVVKGKRICFAMEMTSWGAVDGHSCLYAINN